MAIQKSKKDVVEKEIKKEEKAQILDSHSPEANRSEDMKDTHGEGK